MRAQRHEPMDRTSLPAARLRGPPSAKQLGREGLRAGLGAQLLSGLVQLGGASWVGLVFICGGTEP